MMLDMSVTVLGLFLLMSCHGNAQSEFFTVTHGTQVWGRVAMVIIAFFIQTCYNLTPQIATHAHKDYSFIEDHQL